MNPLMYGGMIPPQYPAPMGIPYAGFDPSKMPKAPQMPPYPNWSGAVPADRYYPMGGAPGYMPFHPDKMPQYTAAVPGVAGPVVGNPPGVTDYTHTAALASSSSSTSSTAPQMSTASLPPLASNLSSHGPIHWNVVTKSAPALTSTSSSNRLAIYLENPQYNFDLIESDLRELFSYYSGVHGIAIMPDYPAAELVLSDPPSCALAVCDLNGIVISGVGTVRCHLLQPGQTLQSLLSGEAPMAASFTRPGPFHSLTDSTNQNGNNGYNLGNQPGNGKTTSGPVATAATSSAAKPSKTEHVPGITRLPNVKRVCRFELLDLFTFEPDFNVAAHILGPSNQNIEYIMTTTNNLVDVSITGKPLNSAPVAQRLHVSVESSDYDAYDSAVEMVEHILNVVCEKHVNYAHKRGKVLSPIVGYKRHEYEETNGELDYKGFIEKPKTWLQQSNSYSDQGSARSFKTNSTGSQRGHHRHGNSTKVQKRVNDKHRTINHRNPGPLSASNYNKTLGRA